MESNKQKVINEVGVEVDRLLNIHYPDDEQPEWIDKEMFKKVYRKRILESALSGFICCLDDYSENSPLTVDIDKSILAFALVSMEFEEPDSDNIRVGNRYTNTITFSANTVMYFIDIITAEKPKTKRGWTKVENKLKRIFET